MRGIKAILCLACGLFAACGKDHNLSDAGTSDANTTDGGNTIDADAHGTVKVTVMNPDQVSGPMAGVQVAFIEPDGTLAAEATTDAGGKASASVLPGASVTAVFVFSQTSHQLETIMGVKPGDDLVIGVQHPDTTAAGTFTVNVIDVVGSTRYDVYGPCGSGSYVVPTAFRGPRPLGVIATVPITLTMTNDCVQSTMDLVAVRSDLTGLVGYTELANTAFTDGGMVTQTAAWTAWPPTVDATYSNVPTDVGQFHAVYTVPDASGYQWNTYFGQSGGTATASFDVPLASRALVRTNFGGGQHNGSQWIDEIVDGTKATYAVDIGASLLPWIDAPTIDVTTGTITTPSTGTGGPGDAFRVDYTYSRPDPGGGGSGTIDNYEWIVWAPTVGAITLPALPSDLAVNDPTTGDTDDGGSAVLGDLDLATGYDAVRAHLDSAYEIYRDTGHGAIGKLRLSTSDPLPATFTK